jgi:carbamoyltransferase
MYILGLNLSHDSSACLLKDGEPRVALALERLVRVRRGLLQPTEYTRGMWQLIQYCIHAEKISLCDINYFVGSSTECRGEEEEYQMLQGIGISNSERILTLPHPAHHLAHASAAFFSSGFEQAACLVVDAYGSRVGPGRETESAFFFDSGQPRLVFRNFRPSARIAGMLRNGRMTVPSDLSGIGEIYRIITLALGFHQTGTYYDDAGKTMGLAPYGRLLSKDPQMIRVTGDGLDFSNAFHFLRECNVINEADGFAYLNAKESSSPFSQFHKDLAAQVQWEFEEGCLYLVHELLKTTGTDTLVLGGGGFLNSVANHRIARESGVRHLFIFPAATDDGNALGAAMYAYHVLLSGKKRNSSVNGTAGRVFNLGRHYQDQQIESSLKASGLTYNRLASVAHAAERAAEISARNGVVGWYQGGAEFGPRALGNRSILANPMSPNIKDRLNTRVKFRESFRPFAASVLEEYAHELFELAYATSPLMLLVCQVRKSALAILPGVTHVDGSCRVQTVKSSDNPEFSQLIQCFKEITSVPAVLNTSFNLRGMPIVETPDDAIQCFLSTQMDALFIGTYAIEPPPFESFVPVRHDFEVAAEGRWGSNGKKLPLAELRVSLRRSDLDSSQTVHLSQKQLFLLLEIDGISTIDEIASHLDQPCTVVIAGVLELYRLGLLYWRHLSIPKCAGRARNHFGLTESDLR